MNSTRRLNKYMKTTGLIFLFVLTVLDCSDGQENQVFPTLPFSLETAIERGYNKASISIRFYQKEEEDESGYPWSTPIDNGYRVQAFDFSDGKMRSITDYLPNGNQAKQLIYYYKGDLCGAIDEVYPSVYEGRDSVACTHFFIYDQYNQPFQKVSQYTCERNFRVLFDYAFDKEKRMTRERVRPVGKIQKTRNIRAIGDKQQNQITLTEYRHNAEIRRVYKDLHHILATYHTYLDEYGNPTETEIQNADREAIAIIDYDYEGKRLVQKHFYNPRLREGEGKLVKRIYYSWNEEGLIGRELIEEGNRQTILEYTYFSD